MSNINKRKTNRNVIYERLDKMLSLMKKLQRLYAVYKTIKNIESILLTKQNS